MISLRLVLNNYAHIFLCRKSVQLDSARVDHDNLLLFFASSVAPKLVPVRETTATCYSLCPVLGGHLPVPLSANLPNNIMHEHSCCLWCSCRSLFGAWCFKGCDKRDRMTDSVEASPFGRLTYIAKWTNVFVLMLCVHFEHVPKMPWETVVFVIPENS